MAGPSERRTILCVDEDRDIAEILQALFTDEGYATSCLYHVENDAVMRAVGRLEPDVVLLDSGNPADYGASWQLAAALHTRPRPVPVVMFTAHQSALDEAREGTTQRAEAAAFAAIVGKPFDIDELLVTVARAAGRSVPFDRSTVAEASRTKELVKALRLHGAADIKPSKMREWALFRDRAGSLVQIYWWQQGGVYEVGRYRDTGEMTMIGQFVDRDLAIELVLPAEEP
jgi:CheY-like chemotaxis protein